VEPDPVPPKLKISNSSTKSINKIIRVYVLKHQICTLLAKLICLLQDHFERGMSGIYSG